MKPGPLFSYKFPTKDPELLEFKPEGLGQELERKMSLFERSDKFEKQLQIGISRHRASEQQQRKPITSMANKVGMTGILGNLKAFTKEDSKNQRNFERPPIKQVMIPGITSGLKQAEKPPVQQEPLPNPKQDSKPQPKPSSDKEVHKPKDPSVLKIITESRNLFKKKAKTLELDSPLPAPTNRTKQQSNSPPASRRPQLTTQWFQDSKKASTCSTELPLTIKGLRQECPTNLRLRQKSADCFNFGDASDYNKVMQFVIRNKLIADCEILEQKELINRFLQHETTDENESSTSTLYHVLLTQLVMILDLFLDTLPLQLVVDSMEIVKEIIAKFEKLKTDYNKKLEVGTSTLSSVQKHRLDFLFSQIRYIFTRFGRLVSVYEALLTYYRLQTYKTIQPVKRAPHITKIIQSSIKVASSNTPTSQGSSTSSPFSKDSPFISSTRSLFNHEIELYERQKKNSVLFPEIGKKKDLDLVPTKVVLKGLSQKQKEHAAVLNYFSQQTTAWRDQLEQERIQTMPIIQCRMGCNQKFYADQVKKHSEFCIKRGQKTKEQTTLNQQFLQISSKATETMLYIQKQTTERTIRPITGGATPQPFNQRSLLSTPTLQRRNFLEQRAKFTGNKNIDFGLTPQIQSKPLEQRQNTFTGGMAPMAMRAPDQKTVKQITSKLKFMEFDKPAAKEKPKVDTGLAGLVALASSKPEPENKVSNKSLVSKESDLQRQTSGNSARAALLSAVQKPSEEDKQLQSLEKLRSLGLGVIRSDAQPELSKRMQTPYIRQSTLKPSLKSEKSLNQIEEFKQFSLNTKIQGGDKNAATCEKKPVQGNYFAALSSLRKQHDEEAKQPQTIQVSVVDQPQQDKIDVAFPIKLKEEIKTPAQNSKVNLLFDPKRKKESGEYTPDVNKNQLSSIKLMKSPYLKQLGSFDKNVPNLTMSSGLPKVLSENENSTQDATFIKNQSLIFSGSQSSGSKALQESGLKDVTKLPGSQNSSIISSPFLGISQCQMTQKEKQEYWMNVKTKVDTRVEKYVNKGSSGRRVESARSSYKDDEESKNSLQDDVLEAQKDIENLKKSLKLNKRPIPCSLPNSDKSPVASPKNKPKPSIKPILNMSTILENQLEESQITVARRQSSLKPDDKPILPTVSPLIQVMPLLESTTQPTFTKSDPLKALPLNLEDKKSSVNTSTPQTLESNTSLQPVFQYSGQHSDSSDSDNVGELAHSQFNMSNQKHLATPMMRNINSTREAKKELDMLESIKTMAGDAFNVVIQADTLSYEQQKSLLALQLEQMQANLSDNQQMSLKTVQVGQDFVKALQHKLGDLTELMFIEKQYLSTLPQTVLKQKKEDEKMAEQKLKQLQQKVLQSPISSGREFGHRLRQRINRGGSCEFSQEAARAIRSVNLKKKLKDQSIKDLESPRKHKLMSKHSALTASKAKEIVDQDDSFFGISRHNSGTDSAHLKRGQNSFGPLEVIKERHQPGSRESAQSLTSSESKTSSSQRNSPVSKKHSRTPSGELSYKKLSRCSSDQIQHNYQQKNAPKQSQFKCVAVESDSESDDYHSEGESTPAHVVNYNQSTIQTFSSEKNQITEEKVTQLELPKMETAHMPQGVFTTIQVDSKESLNHTAMKLKLDPEINQIKNESSGSSKLQIQSCDESSLCSQLSDDLPSSLPTVGFLKEEASPKTKLGLNVQHYQSKMTQLKSNFDDLKISVDEDQDYPKKVRAQPRFKPASNNVPALNLGFLSNSFNSPQTQGSKRSYLKIPNQPPKPQSRNSTRINDGVGSSRTGSMSPLTTYDEQANIPASFVNHTKNSIQKGNPRKKMSALVLRKTSQKLQAKVLSFQGKRRLSNRSRSCISDIVIGTNLFTRRPCDQDYFNKRNAVFTNKQKDGKKQCGIWSLSNYSRKTQSDFQELCYAREMKQQAQPVRKFSFTNKSHDDRSELKPESMLSPINNHSSRTFDIGSIELDDVSNMTSNESLSSSEEAPHSYESESAGEELDKTSEDVLTMDDVRFSSCKNLPSHIESCQLDHAVKETVHQKVTINDFILLKTVSSGAYGKVILARKKQTKDLFAIKVLDKRQMVEKNVAEFVMNERNILNQVDNDFIVRGMYTFQSQRYLYMVMEYMKGGDFGNLLDNVGCFNYETAKFYLAHVVMALEHLHSKGIVHRDLKPENMLIAADGHVKLTDFGLSEAGLRKILDQAQPVKNKLSSQMEGFTKRNQSGGEHKVSGQINPLEATIQPRNQGFTRQAMESDIRNQLGFYEHAALPQKEQQLLDTYAPNYKDFGKQKDPPVEGQVANKHRVFQHSQTFKRSSTLSNVESSDLEAPQAKKRGNRILGTADYMAPEVILGQDVNYMLDFWSLGVIGFEFFTGSLPFNDDSPELIFRNIMSKEIDWPSEGSEDGQIHPVALEFLQALLQRDQKKRLGSQNGIKDIKEHPFFADVDWKNLHKEPAPWLPKGKDNDMANFPKAAGQVDKDLQTILEVEQTLSPQEQTTSPQLLTKEKEFADFEGVSYQALQAINEKEAEKAMRWAQRQLKKMKEKGQSNTQNRFSDSEQLVVTKSSGNKLQTYSMFKSDQLK